MSFWKMRRRILDHAVFRVRRSFYNHELIGRLSPIFSCRRSIVLMRRRWLFLLFHIPFAEKQTIENNTDADEKRNDSYQAQGANDLCIVHILARDCIEEKVEKNRHANPDKTGNHSSFDFVEAFLLRRVSANAVDLFRGWNPGKPAFAPIGFFRTRSHRIPDTAQICAAIFAELCIFGRLNATSRTEHIVSWLKWFGLKIESDPDPM